MEVGEKQGGDWITGQLTTVCALTKAVNLNVQKSCTGLAKAKIDF